MATTTHFANGDIKSENDTATSTIFNTGQMLHVNANGTVDLGADGTTQIFNALATFTVSITGLISGVNQNGSISLAASGIATIGNASGGITLNSDGSVNINGVVFEPNGDTTIPTSLVLNGKQIMATTIILQPVQVPQGQQEETIDE